LVWFGLAGFSFNASLEPQLRVRRRARLAEDAPARNAFWTGRARPNPGAACAAQRRLISLADDVSVMGHVSRFVCVIIRYREPIHDTFHDVFVY